MRPEMFHWVFNQMLSQDIFLVVSETFVPWGGGVVCFFFFLSEDLEAKIFSDCIAC